MSVVQDIDDIGFLRACLIRVDDLLAEMPKENVIDQQSLVAHRKDLIDRINELRGRR